MFRHQSKFLQQGAGNNQSSNRVNVNKCLTHRYDAAPAFNPRPNVNLCHIPDDIQIVNEQQMSNTTYGQPHIQLGEYRNQVFKWSQMSVAEELKFFDRRKRIFT